MTSVIAERALDYFGDAGIEHGAARIFLPYDEGQNWRCDYELSWPGYQHKFYVCGDDSWQALQLAMQIIPVMISVTDDFKAGRLGWLGERVLTKAELIRWLAPQSMDVLEE
jgi:hypothetical protein